MFFLLFLQLGLLLLILCFLARRFCSSCFFLRLASALLLFLQLGLLLLFFLLLLLSQPQLFLFLFLLGQLQFFLLLLLLGELHLLLFFLFGQLRGLALGELDRFLLLLLLLGQLFGLLSGEFVRGLLLLFGFGQFLVLLFLALVGQPELFLLLLRIGRLQFLLLAFLGSGPRQRLARGGGIGVARDRLVVVIDGLGALTLLFVGEAALVVGFRVLGVDLDDAIEVRDRLVVAAGADQRRGAGVSAVTFFGSRVSAAS